MKTASPDAVIRLGGVPVPLEAVLRTEELSRRPSRPPDYAGENRALARLARALVDSPDTVLQTVAEVVLGALRADSAGLSLLSEDGESFHWPAIAGAWKREIGGSSPRNGSPWGDVLDRDMPLLFAHPEQRYPCLAPGAPGMEECLLVPLHVNGQGVGALWVGKHAAPQRRKRHDFDTEDLRLLVSLGDYASVAYQSQALSRGLRERDSALQLGTVQLAQSALELQRASKSSAARRAALNLMEDAVEARRVAELLNTELRASEVRLARELEGARQLQRVSSQLIEGGDIHALYAQIVEAAVVVMRAAGASLHAVEDKQDALRLLAFRGFGPEFGERVAWCAADERTSCGRARRLGQRVVVSDVETCEFLAGTPALDELRVLGVRALQTTPLMSRSGQLLGLVSTHWRKPHSAAESELRALDILARQAADLIDRKRSEAAMAQLAAIIASSDDAIIGKDLDGIVTSWNDAAARLFGHAPVDAIGEPETELIPREQLDAQREILERIRRGESAQHYESVHQREAGGPIAISVTVSPVRDANGQLIGASTIARDITERTRAEAAIRRSELQLRFMAESMPQKIFTANADGEDEYLNEQWLEYAGLSFEQLKARGWMGIIHPDDSAETRRLWQHSVETGKSFQVEHRFRRGDGQYRWHLSRARAMRDPSGQVVIWIGSSTDVQEVKEADRRKDEFLAMLAHELRNPLAPVIHAARLLRDPDLGPDASQRAAEVIERQTARMARLIDDLLDVSRITRGMVELRRQRVDLRGVLDAAREANEPRMLQKRQRFSGPVLAESIWLDADAVRLEQVISNLLDNAVKYTPPGGRIELTVERQGDQVVVRVCDDGIGISGAMIPHIFELFSQEKTGNISQGLGIGLTVVRSLVELHGGTIAARSSGPGRGSEFTLRLPVLPDAIGSADALQTQSAAEHVSRRRILVVEDNEDAAEILTLLLERWGHEVHAVADGSSALDAAGTVQPDLVLLDVGLPGMSGYEVARELRRQPATARVRIVAMTGYGQVADRARTREAGFDEHLVKPVSVDALRDALTRAPRRS